MEYIAGDNLEDTLEKRSQKIESDGQTLALGSSDGKVELWRVGDGLWLKSLGQFDADVMSVAFSGDGRWVAAGFKGWCNQALARERRQPIIAPAHGPYAIGQQFIFQLGWSHFGIWKR
jgi:hypothetical protein